LDPHSGYGNDGIAIATALTQAGADVYLDPTVVTAPLPAAVAALLTKRLEPPFDLLLHHVDPSALGLSEPARANATATVAWTMWEFTTMDNLVGRSTLRRRLRSYDLVVGYDQVSTAAVAPYLSGATKLATVQGGFWPQVWPPVARTWTGDRFAFCMVGALHHRKNPMAAIEAFRELREEHPEQMRHVELNIKTVAPGLHPKLQDWAPGLRIYYEVWDERAMRQFYADQHVLLAPSRGEGKNLPALEMLSTGGTVIATNWGGHTQWLSDAYAYPLRYTLEPVHPRTPRCCWATPEQAHLKELMLHTVSNRDQAQRKGTIAAQLIGDMCGWRPVLDRLFLRIADLIPGTGERLLHAWRVTKENARKTSHG
jgi:glycosyltransferase involved in cell wall biosynthesis